MKKALNPLVAVVMFATMAFAANVENPLYAPAQLGFYSKTGFSSMYKKSDANLAMQAKDWEHEQEFPIWRIYEDFGFGLTNRFALRGAFGYTHDGAIDRSGPHNARLGLNYRGVNWPVVWDLYMDAWLGGISKMKANLIASSKKTPTYPLTFKYDNYANGRWGMWFGTVVGKTFDKLTVSAFGEYQVTFGNSNNQIKIDSSAKPIIKGLVYQSVYPGVHSKALENLPQVIAGVCQQNNIPEVYCNREALGEEVFTPIEEGAKNYLKTVAEGKADTIARDYVNGLSKDFSVNTKGTVDYVAGLKTLYEINNNWSMGGGFTWRHRATNSVEKVNIANTSKNPDTTTVKTITQGIGNSFKGSMEDGVEEFTLTLLGTRQFTDHLQLTLFGEYTFDTAQDKAQLGSDIRAEVGLRMNWQF
jgi:hypothetical protein